MSALFANPVTLTVLPPLLAGLLLGLLAWVTAGNRVAMAIGWALGVVFVYWLLEGVPPLPPAAAKQKLGYLIALGGLAGVVWSLFPGNRPFTALASLVLAVVAVLWLGWSKVIGGGNMGVVLLAAALAILLAAGMIGWIRSQDRAGAAEEPFLAPAVQLTTAIAGSIVAASGLFLGMGQMLGALSAMLGGALAISYAALLIRGRGLDLLPPGAALAVGNAVLCGVALTALLAPSPSLNGLIVLALGPVLAFLLRGRIAALLPQTQFLRPILAGAIIAIPAIAASLIAVLTGTGPFA